MEFYWRLFEVVLMVGIVLWAVRMGYRMGRETQGYSPEPVKQEKPKVIDNSDPWEDAALRVVRSVPTVPEGGKNV